MRKGGFTLVEMLVVIAVIALIGAMALPSISSYFRISLSSVTRELATTVKEAYNAAVITGRVHRVVYDLKANQYWVEQGPNEVLLDTAASKEKEARRKRLFSKKEEEETPTYSFSMARTVTRKQKPLPRGVTFEDVVSEVSDKPITEGKAYTHIFPHGLSERALIHLKDSQAHQITLVLTSLMGKTQVEEGYVKPQELKKNNGDARR